MVLTQWQQRQWPRIEAEIERAVEAIRRLDPQKIALFGSHARGDFHEGSDIDLLVIIDMPGRMVDRIGRVLDVLEPEMTVQPLVYRPQEYAELKARNYFLVETIEREGRVLYERECGPEPY